MFSSYYSPIRNIPFVDRIYSLSNGLDTGISGQSKTSSDGFDGPEWTLPTDRYGILHLPGTGQWNEAPFRAVFSTLTGLRVSTNMEITQQVAPGGLLLFPGSTIRVGTLTQGVRPAHRASRNDSVEQTNWGDCRAYITSERLLFGTISNIFLLFWGARWTTTRPDIGAGSLRNFDTAVGPFVTFPITLHKESDFNV